MNDYCECGLAEEDPLHNAWHKIKDHDYVFKLNKYAREKAFDDMLRKRGTPGRQTKNVPDVQERENTLWPGQ